jgi:hypothetical protein
MAIYDEEDDEHDEDYDCCMNHCDQCGCMDESHYHCANCNAVTGMFGHTRAGSSEFTCKRATVSSSSARTISAITLGGG